MSFLGLPQWAWIAAGVALLMALFYVAFIWLRKRQARKAIDNVISSVAHEELHDVLLTSGGQQLHINYLLLTERGLLVIDYFDVPGVIFAGEKMEQWSVFGDKRRFTFTNPLPMLYDRVAAVRQLAGKVPVEGRIVFSMRGEFPKGQPQTVLRLDALQAEFPVVEKSPGSAAAAFATVWEQIKAATRPNPLAR